MKAVLGMIFVFFFLIGSLLDVGAAELRISVITASEGDELYSYFGHSAIRVQSPATDYDVVYNFGTFDFNTPHFYLRFAKGDLNYCLSASYYDSFVAEYRYEDRSLHEQVLHLTDSEAQRLVAMLEHCYNSTERYYRYDFFRNNCATKICDFIEAATDKRIDFSQAVYDTVTFRELLLPYIKRNYWIDLGLALVLGLHTDDTATARDYMFLPCYIEDFLAKSNFVDETNTLYQAHSVRNSDINFSHILPWLIIASLSALYLWRKTRSATFVTTMIMVGILGIFLLIFSLYTEHYPAKCNLNTVWTIPALFAVLPTGKKIKFIFRLIYAGIIVGLFCTWPIFPQYLSPTYIPWFIFILFLLLHNIFVEHRKQNLHEQGNKNTSRA